MHDVARLHPDVGLVDLVQLPTEHSEHSDHYGRARQVTRLCLVEDRRDQDAERVDIDRPQVRIAACRVR